MMLALARSIAGGCLLLGLTCGCSAPAKAPAAKETAHESAADLLAELKAVKFPEFDRTKRQDMVYIQEYSAKYQAAMDRRTSLSKKFVDEYPDDPAAPDLAMFLAETFTRPRAGTVRIEETASGRKVIYEGAEEAEKKQLAMYRHIVAKYPGTNAAKAAAGPIRQVDDIGKPFALSFIDAIGGKKIDLADMKGKVVVVDFWATWCGPCVGEMPTNNEIYQKYHDQGVEFVGVSLDQPVANGGLAALKNFVASNGIPWPQYYQGDGGNNTFAESWGILAIPTVFIIDKNGNLYSTEARGQLETLIPHLLAQRTG